MLRHHPCGWWVGLLMALVMTTTAPAVSAASSKTKTVHHTGIVKTVTPTSISLEEHHMLAHHIRTYTLSSSPKLESATGTVPDAVTSIPVGAKVALTGTEEPDKKVMITEIKVLELPKAGGKKK
jgi:hypothetical protein